MTAWTTILLVTGAFLIGAIPFSWILARLFGGVDIRMVGSGNGSERVGSQLWLRVEVVNQWREGANFI